MSGSSEVRLPLRKGFAAAGLVSLALVAGAGFASGDSKVDPAFDRYAKPQWRVSLPDGRRMNLLCEGTGSPTVILEAGAGSSTLEWRKVQPAIAETTRVCAYDRAGMGFSDAGPLPRSAAAVVADLEALLRAAAIRPPYVVVAHSLGSYYARLFTDQHLEMVSGMVLVDPSVEYQDRRFSEISSEFAELLKQDRERAQECLRLARAGKLTAELPIFKECTYGYSREPGFSEALFAVQIKRRLSVPFREALLSETDEMDADSQELLAARRSYGDMPLIVLTQSPESAEAYPGLSEAQVEAMNTLWVRMHDELARLSSRGENQVVEHSGHYIQKDRPEVVISAIRRVVEDSRKGLHGAA
jgi:pimeloyl-ACP methyl ester carboxylesterase